MKHVFKITAVILLISFSAFADVMDFGANGSQDNSSQGALGANTDSAVPSIGSLYGGTNQMSIDSTAPDIFGKNNFNFESYVNSPNLVTKKNGYNPQIHDPFESNVFIRTGMKLDLYGTNLFKLADSFSPPIANKPVPSSYIVGPGDVINIQIWGAINGSSNLVVAPDGTIYVPKLGVVSLTGVRASNLSSYIKTKFGHIYRNFEVNAVVAKVRSIQVVVAGFASMPGLYTISSLSTLSNAIFAVGGPSGIGSMRNIELKRNGVIIGHFDLYDYLINGNSTNDIQLIDADTIIFKPIGNQVAIYDGVKRPSIYETKSGDTLSNLVSYAGGYSSDSNHNNVIFETMNKNQAIVVKKYATKDVENAILSDGTIIHFFKTQNRYVDTVALIGNVANPTRVGYHSGMRISDIIPSKDMLLTPSYYNSYAGNTYGVDNVLSQLSLEKTTTKDANNIGDNGVASTTTNQFNANHQNLFVAGPVNIPEADIDWNYALIIRQNPDNYITHIIPFNLARAISKDKDSDLMLMPGDVINILSTRDVRIPSNSTPIYVFIDGEVKAPGVYEFHTGATLKDLIESAGGVSSAAYIYGMQLNRMSVQKQQSVVLNQMLDQAQQSLTAQAGVAMATPASSSMQAQSPQAILTQQQQLINQMRKIKPTGRVVLNLKSYKATVSDLPKFELENGDTVYIPAKPNVVNVIGQVYNPSTFIYAKHKTVGDYINMAGTENDFADSSMEYILRADGELYSKQQSPAFGMFSMKTLNPGDTIIVPQQMQPGAFLTGLMNWTQILANTAQTSAIFFLAN